MSTLVLPSGELLAIEDADVAKLADAFDEIDQAMNDLKSIKRTMQDEIIRRLDFEGRRQITEGGYRVKASQPTVKVWNVKRLQGVLRELVDEGTISQRKADACLVWEPKAIPGELKTLLSDPRCQGRLSACQSDQPTTRYAKVERV